MRWRLTTERRGAVEDEHGRAEVPSFATPNLNIERCVHAASPLALCSACQTACPNKAWHITDRLPQLDQEACDGCGLCRPACPEDAIELPVKPALRQNSDGGLTVFAACARATQAQDGAVPCLHAFGTRDLKTFARQGVTRIVANNSACSACPAPPDARLDQKLQDFNAIQQSRNAPVLQLDYLPAEAWRRIFRSHRKHATFTDPSRRWFIGLAQMDTLPTEQKTSKSDVDAMNWLYGVIPEIDPAQCNGCDACMRLCPHGVISLESAEGRPYYAIDADQCTGCGLCQDVCDQRAISLQRMAHQTQRLLYLKTGQCTDCGAPYHMPYRHADYISRCRICTNKGGKNRLFQVMK